MWVLLDVLLCFGFFGLERASLVRYNEGFKRTLDSEEEPPPERKAQCFCVLFHPPYPSICTSMPQAVWYYE